MSSPKVLFGFHAVGVRLKTAPQSIIEIYYEATRRDARMRQFLDRAREAGARLIEADSLRIAKLAGSHGHQGVAARVQPLPQATSLDELLEDLEAAGVEQPLLLVLDGVTDPHNLWIIGTSDDAPQTLYQADLKGPVALVLGAEGDGMRQLTRKTCDALVSIPMKGAVESLNVSVASGVCLYEALRQRAV